MCNISYRLTKSVCVYTYFFLKVVSSLGVGTIVISNAAKVDKGYFGSHLFRDPFEMRNKLVEGLMQSGDTALPRVIVAKRLKVFLEDNIDAMFPNGTHTRVVAHPRRSDDEVSVPCMSEVRYRNCCLCCCTWEVKE